MPLLNRLAAGSRSLRDLIVRRLAPRTLKIGISARMSHPQPGARGLESKPLQYLEQSVAHWVMSRDVLLFMIPTANKDGLIHRGNIRVGDYARVLDGLVLQGGADICPLTYGEDPLDAAWAGDRLRDVYEIELLHEFVEAGKPVLGICRGMQLINVAFGGTLYQDIATQVPQAQSHVTDGYDRHAHGMRFEPGSGLARLYPGIERGRVISIHHQAVQALGRGLSVEAFAEPDGVIEAIRGDGRNYVLGVQWHPEFRPPGDTTLLDGTPILDEFLRAARAA